MHRVIAISNQKGGVGKTTTTINLAASLAHLKNRVLLIDLDPQGNATMGSGVDKLQLTHSTNEVLLGQVSIIDACVPSSSGYKVLGANPDLTVAEVELIKTAQGQLRLANAVDEARKHFDFILIDCPPSLNMLTLNAFVAADSVLIPMQCEYYALEGLAALIETISQVKEGLNPKLEIEGILRTMYDPRNRLSTDVSAQLFEHFGKKVYRTVIPRNVRLAEAPSHGLAALNYDRRSQGATAYLLLAEQVQKKNSHQAAALA